MFLCRFSHTPDAAGALTALVRTWQYFVWSCIHGVGLTEGAVSVRLDSFCSLWQQPQKEPNCLAHLAAQKSPGLLWLTSDLY